MMPLIYFLAGFVGLEVISAAIHRWLMHGPLWFIHASHHRPGRGFFQRNDVFTLLFGGTGVYLLLQGINSLNPGFWIGVGISVYGVAYFLLHDMLVHRRLKGWISTNIPYFKALQQAHRAHHKWVDKNPGESYGLFLFPKRFLK